MRILKLLAGTILASACGGTAALTEVELPDGSVAEMHDISQDICGSTCGWSIE
jgi:hypothetical protein